MKKLLIILAVIAISTQVSFAQNNKIYVCTDGGAKTIFSFNKLTYNAFYYHSIVDNACDTLICKGEGYVACKFKKDIYKDTLCNKDYYKAYNKAMKVTRRTIKRSKQESGSFSVNYKSIRMNVDFYDAKQNGESKIEISIL